MFAQITPMMNNEVQYRSDLYRQEAERDRQARQAKQGQEVTRKQVFAFLTGAKKSRLNVQPKGL